MKRIVCSIVAGLALVPGLVAAQTPRASALTAQDRTEIQALVTRYVGALGGCNAEEFAGLFAPDTGYFASNIRGEVVGRERLMALVRSERHCIGAAAATATAPAARPGGAPTTAIEETAAGVTGRVELGANVGRYEDEYVKTAAGWRFKARTVITRAEDEAKLNAHDTHAIRRLAGAELGHFGDLYVAGPDGVKRFRTSGIALGLSAEGVTGRAYLKDESGRYDDVYVRTATGWRFKSRVFVPAEEAR